MAGSGVLAIVLAGGEGKRLWPLTADRAKPAVPFGGNYRLVDFVLSNLVNAGITKVAVLTQYKSHSLDRHIATTWRLTGLRGEYVAPVPAQQRVGKRWFTGSADALYQSLNLVFDEDPEHVVVFGADHVYRMDPRQMLAQHEESGAGVTVAGIRVPRSEASAFGVITAREDGTVEEFLEKPEDPPGLPDDPDSVYASMGNYVFRRDVLEEAVRADAEDDDSTHDMGGDILPAMVRADAAHVYDYTSNRVPGASERDLGYWRDVGTIDAYYEAHRDLISVHPVFNLYNRRWPILTATPPLPPAKFVFDEDGRRGTALNSSVCSGAIVSGATVRESFLSPLVFVHTGARVDGSVLLDGADVGRGAVVRRAIVDKGVRVPPGYVIGVDAQEDRRRFTRETGPWTVSEGGVVVIGKGAQLPQD